ncbi:MAG: YciI family protein [Calditrichia bacterium]
MENNKQLPPVYFVLFHTPGNKWIKDIPFQEQPGVKDHVQYMSSFMESKTLVIGGPFLDNSGGMMVCKAESQEAAEKIANEDPGVKSGLLKVEIKRWLVPMATVR